MQIPSFLKIVNLAKKKVVRKDMKYQQLLQNVQERVMFEGASIITM